MSKNLAYQHIQIRLEELTGKWWFYLILLLPIFIRPYATQPYEPGETIDVIMQALSKPLIYTFPFLFPIAKLIPLILILAVMAFGNRFRNAFNLYFTLLFLAIALFQNTALTEKYGLVITTGNMISVLLVAIAWRWEIIARRNDFSKREQALWRWWVMPLAALALLAPVDSGTLTPDFSVARMLTSESGLTNCMVLPVVLAVLTFYYPTVNLVLLRIVSLVGMYFGVINVIIWFFVLPHGWWMGVLHIPLITLSGYGFILGHLKPKVSELTV